MNQYPFGLRDYNFMPTSEDIRYYNYHGSLPIIISRIIFNLLFIFITIAMLAMLFYTPLGLVISVAILQSAPYLFGIIIIGKLLLF